jgi:hypothetical protein
MRVSSGVRSPRPPSRASFSSTTISKIVFYRPAGPCQVFCFENTLLMPLGMLRNNYAGPSMKKHVKRKKHPIATQ